MEKNYKLSSKGREMNLKGISIEVEAISASFREAAGQLYHETLPLPPPSTLAGFAGAAMGKSFEETLNFFKQYHIGVGCQGNYQGKGRDLWNYEKIKSGGKAEKDIVIREFLYGFSGNLYYICEDEEIAKELYNAFTTPYYGLTLGTSDEIVKLNKITWYDDLKLGESSEIENTWICGDQLSNIELDWGKITNTPIAKTIKPAIVKLLPTDYKFEADGARQACSYQTFTFLGDNQKPANPVSVYFFDDTVAFSCYIFNEKGNE